MGSGSYVLVHFSDQDKFLPAIQTLNHSTDVDQWSAVDGNRQVIIKLKPSSTFSLPDEVLKLDGIDDLTQYNIRTDYQSDRSVDTSLRCSYVFVEAEPLKSEMVKSALETMDSTRSCATLESGCEFMVMVEGKDFDRIDGIINGRIRMLDGVLRLKKNRVIELREM